MILFVFLASLHVLTLSGGKGEPEAGGGEGVGRKGTFERELVRLRFFFLD